MEQKEEPGKVPIKTILKGNAAQAIRPASVSGFKVADFQINPAAKETAEDHLRKEISSLQSKIAVLNDEVAKAQKKVEFEVKIAYEKGVQEGKLLGLAEGEQKALKQWKELLNTLRDETAQSIEAFALQQKEIFAKIENVSTELAVAVAKRVFCEEATQNPNIIANVMQEAFTFLGQEEKIKARLNPLDITFAEETESFWKPVLTQLKDVELVLDKTIEKGGCLLEAENGSSIDMRIKTIFGHIEETVKRLYSKSN